MEMIFVNSLLGRIISATRRLCDKGKSGFEFPTEGRGEGGVPGGLKKNSAYMLAGKQKRL
jgi:hypothetical protein